MKLAPIMFWVQDLWPESLSAAGAVHSAKVLKIVEKLVRLIYKGSDRILLQSRAFTAPIQGVDPERIIYFPNAAEAVLTMYRMPETKRHAMGLRGRSYFEKNFKNTMLLNRLNDWMKDLREKVKKCAS